MPHVDPSPPEIRSTFSNLLGRRVISVDAIGGGRNSRIYRITCEPGERYVVKFYFRHPSDRRDRLEVEFSSLQFLWDSGVRVIPRPVMADADTGRAVYEYIEGTVIDPGDVTGADIDKAAEFLSTLRKLATGKTACHLRPASEACFSIQAIVENVTQRFQRLSALPVDDGSYEELHDFLNNEFLPEFKQITAWCEACLDPWGLSFSEEIEDRERTLSPSDFGYHNALRRHDGTIIFLDFEYFGWDDPAKMVVDFLLHPAMTLSDDLKRRFTTRILNHFSDHRVLCHRVALVYPLFGLKWCLILLNEFVPEHLLRRDFASTDNLRIRTLRTQQLTKARRMLHTVGVTYKHFPYEA